MGAFQPSGASGGQLIAEVSDTPASDELRTKSSQFVQEVVDEPSTRLLVLTGDAGHGKTHLCRQLLASQLGSSDARELVRLKADGSQDLAQLPSGRALHIIKDLSELSEWEGARRLADALRVEDRVTVACANEGRLRKAISLEPRDLEPVRESLDNVLRVGATEAHGNGVHVLDMNHQSVATDSEQSLTLQLLRSWAIDQRKWSACHRCDARTLCPIFENHRLLDGDDPRSKSRRSGMAALLRLAEQTGHVITIRELLIFVAHCLTAGLSCHDVHDRVRRKPGDKSWQHQYLYHQAAFGDLLETGERSRLRVFAATGLLDPGRSAVRPVDDALAMGRGTEEQGWFVPPAASEHGTTARTRSAQRSQANSHRSHIRFLRRRAFFEAEANGEASASFAERVGLRYYDEFMHLLRPEVTDKDKVHVRNQLLAGLEAIQGARRRSGQASFLVVDPAFASHRGSASVVAHQVQVPRVGLQSQTEYWGVAGNTAPDLDAAVDWIDRKVFVVMPDRGQDGPVAIDLDSRQFELVMRAGQGLVSREFFQADIRRLMSQLALVAEAAPEPSDSEITVLLGGVRRKLVIDVGDVIVATEV